MPVCEVWHAKQVFVIKRGKGKGYAAIENTLFFKKNTRMFYGNADDKIREVISNVGNAGNIEIEIKKEVKVQEETHDEENPIQMPNEGEYFKAIGIPKEVFEDEKRIAITAMAIPRIP